MIISEIFIFSFVFLLGAVSAVIGVFLYQIFGKPVLPTDEAVDDDISLKFYAEGFEFSTWEDFKKRLDDDTKAWIVLENPTTGEIQLYLNNGFAGVKVNGKYFRSSEEYYDYLNTEEKEHKWDDGLEPGEMIF
jgi:hypothetical protein